MSRTATVLGLITVLCGLLLPFAPVAVNDPVVNWPRDSEAPKSTLALFMPYRPLDLAVQLPCAALRTARTQTVVFATYPQSPEAAADGLTVLAGNGGFRVTSAGRAVHEGPVPAGECTVAVRAGTAETVVEVDRKQLAAVRLGPPQVTAFATDLSQDAAHGLRATAHADARFESSPTGIKLALVLLHLALIGGCLALLRRRDRAISANSNAISANTGAISANTGAIWAKWADVVVLGVLAGWAVIGPVTDDDGYYTAMARSAADTGFVGNYYHWFNAAEAPFTLVQQVLAPWVSLSQAPLWLRLPSVLAALGCWLVISRAVLPRLLGSGRGRQWLTAAVFLAWVLPFGIGVRPEPWVALGSVTVLALCLRARATGRLVPLGLAAATAGITAATTPSGLIAFAPLVAMAGPLWRLVGGWRTGLLVAACATTALTAVFADASLGAVVEATRIHSEIGPALHWWQELTRYWFLLDEGSMGSFAKRLPVLLALGVLLLVLGLRLRGGRPLASAMPAAALALAFGVLCLAPSKWTHHFGALAGLGTVVITLLLRELPAALAAGRFGLPARLGMGAGFAVLVALAMAGPNAWYGHSQFGIERDLPAVLANPALWLALAVLCGLWWHRGSLRGAALDSSRVVIVLGVVSSLALTVGTFAVATVNLRDSWSMARQNLRHLIGTSCGMADQVRVLDYRPLTAAAAAPQGLGRVDSLGRVHTPPPVPVPVWGSFGPGFGPGNEWFTGSITTPWFELPPLAGDDDISVLLTGKLDLGNSASVEFGAGAAVLDQRPLRDVLDSVEWREFAVGTIPAGADRIRVRLEDGTVGADGWLGVSAPRLRSARPLLHTVGTNRPVLADWPIAFAFPCLRAPQLRHGMAEPPEHVLLPRFRDRCTRFGAPCLPFGVPGIAVDERQGGSFLPAERAAARRTELPSRLVGLPARTKWLGDDWGALLRYDYPFPADGYRITVGSTTMSGLDWGFRQPIERPIEQRRVHEGP